MKSKKIVALWLCLVMIFGFMVIIIEVPTTVSGAIIYVDDDFLIENGTHKKTIQAGVDAAQPGDTVFVYNGTYYENVVIDKTINLTGISADNTTIDGSGSGDVVWVIANWVNISGFMVIGSGTSFGDAGIDLDNVQNCRVFNNTASNNYFGIHLYYSSTNNITGNNAISNNWDGIYLYYTTRNNITSNNASNNVRGISLYYSSMDDVITNNASSNIDFGIRLTYSNKNNITGNNAFNNSFGISLYSSNGNNISGNNVSCNGNGGIRLWESSGNNLTTNTMIEDGIFINPTLLEHWNTHNIDTSNTVNRKPVFYWKNQTGGTIPVGAGQVILANCTNVTIENQVFTQGYIGIEIGYSSNINITGNNVSGIFLYKSDRNNIIENNASNEFFGISLSYSNGNSIISNNASNNIRGISLYYSDGNNITNNNVSSNNDSGINSEFSNENNITCNNVLNNNYGILIMASNSNLIYHNNIINNTNQGYDSTNNLWDNGYPSGGNYWSDYIGVDNFKGPNQDIQGSDGIGDTPYIIDVDSQDNYPLIEPYNNKPLENYTILKQGWNLISIPLIQVEQELIRVLGSINGWYDAVQWFNNNDSNDHWKHNKLGKQFGNDLNDINHTMGFWIHITQPGNTFFVYNGTQPSVNQTLDLSPGWNLVGYPSQSNKNRTDGLNNIFFGSDVDAIWTHNATMQKWKEITASDNFEVGRGYWIHSKVTKTWIVPL